MLKLFISYCHNDEKYVEAFLRHTKKLQDDGLDVWYDRNITAGDDFWDKIESHLSDRDIVCCFISSHYLASRACEKEMNRAIEMQQQQGIVVLPIILSPCAWLDYPNLKRLLAVPTDGKAIASFQNEDEGWMNVYKHLKNVINKYQNLKSLNFSEQYLDFLDDATLLTKAHGCKNELRMSDIYIHPEIERKNNAGKNTKSNFGVLLDNFKSGDKVVLIGEDQSGKTTLAKQLVVSLKKKGFVPIYIKDDNEQLLGNLQNRIGQKFKEQYAGDYTLSDFDVKRVTPIIDDFHKVKHKERILQSLESYTQIIIIVDTIFDIDLIQEKLVYNFNRYTIKQLKPSLRYDLIRKWISVSEVANEDPEFINSEYMRVDERMSAIDQALGKVLGKGIMPSYPFFILSLLSNYDSMTKPINEEITSQGYCYQALITLFLSKQGVKNDSIDTYINFLTEFAHARYQHRNPLSEERFKDFFSLYTKDFNLTEKKEDLLRKLFQSGILRKSSLGNYDFNYPYLYYFFAGKYYAEHLDDRDAENKNALAELDEILDHLHNNENAYISIFIVHHSKEKSLIEKLLFRADGLFKNFQPASMDKEEMAFFRADQVRKIEFNSTERPNEARKKELERLDVAEEKGQEDNDDIEEMNDELSLELRRSMKTVEVIGRILANRSGSIKTAQLKDIFERGMNVHLRLISSFFEIVRRMIVEPNYASFITEKLLEDKPNMKEEVAEDKAQKIFWAINFGFIVGMVHRISASLGSKKIISIVDSVCNEHPTPIKFIIQQDIAMRYSKNLRLDDLDKVESLDFPDVAKNALAFSIVKFCKYNRITDKDREELRRFGIKKQFLLPPTQQG